MDETPFNADHGTLIAGIVSAISNNLTGIAGVSWNATVMAINAGDESDDPKISHGIEGIIYAAINGTDVINISWGGYDNPSKTEEDVIKFANSLGAVVIAAAGNDRKNEPFYPAFYYNVLSAAGTDHREIAAGSKVEASDQVGCEVDGEPLVAQSFDRQRGSIEGAQELEIDDLGGCRVRPVYGRFLGTVSRR